MIRSYPDTECKGVPITLNMNGSFEQSHNAGKIKVGVPVFILPLTLCTEIPYPYLCAIEVECFFTFKELEAMGPLISSSSTMRLFWVEDYETSKTGVLTVVSTRELNVKLPIGNISLRAEESSKALQSHPAFATIVKFAANVVHEKITSLLTTYGDMTAPIKKDSETGVNTIVKYITSLRKSLP